MRLACTRDNTGSPGNRTGGGGPIMDEDLNAYIDGELTADRRCEVERLIASDAAVCLHVETLRRVRGLVYLAFTHDNLETTP
jgi:anti-sigma factor RsiW